MLLAVDLGLSTGLALYGGDGRLIWYRSHHFGSPTQLRRAVHHMLYDLPDLTWLILEGGGPLADVWSNVAAQRSIGVRQIYAETWRTSLFYARDQRNGAQAKRHADQFARQVIAWSGAPGPTALRHDTAEAILIGLWAVLDLGWLAALPAEIRR